MNRALSSCPVCSESFFISELSCESCGTRIKGSFRSCSFCRLTPDQLQFLEVFLVSRGNLSGVGGELGISYPTVAKRLDSVLSALGLNGAEHAEPGPSQEELERERAQALEMLDRGEITAEEATRRLRDL